MSIPALKCFICGVLFRTKQLLSHHLEVALRQMYHDHLILQEEPIRPDVPVAHRNELAALQHFRKITEEVAEEHHVEGGTSLFLTEVTELDAAGQRRLEDSVPGIKLPSGHGIPQMTVVSSTVNNPPVLFDPYTGCDARPTFFASRDNPPPVLKRPCRHRLRRQSLQDSEVYGDDHDICDFSGGEQETVRMWLDVFEGNL
jgi:hypothetical protein